MKKIFIFLLLFPLLAHSQNYSKKRSALFIGNSYTYVNNLPQLVQQLALANGDTLEVDSYAPGGYTFNNHFNDANTHTKIYSKNWDFVILQAQSQEPSFSPGQVNSQTTPFARKLDSLIKDNHACTKTVFYETWGRKFGDAGNCASYPPVCTYSGMQNRLKQSYKLFANNANGVMAPAGEAFRESIAQNPGLELYQADQSHPSMEGTYLAAAVFYETLFQKSVLSNTYISSVSSATAAFLQQVAHTVLRDSLAVWNLGVNLPWADFTFTANLAAYQFQSTAPVSNSVWYFGDGTFTSGNIVQHNYGSSGTFTVSHVVQDACYKDSVVKIINLTVSVGIEESERIKHSLLYPNPAVNELWFSITDGHELEVSNIHGHVVKQTQFTNPLDVSDLKEGLYFLELSTPSGSQYFRFVKGGQ